MSTVNVGVWYVTDVGAGCRTAVVQVPNGARICGVTAERLENSGRWRRFLDVRITRRGKIKPRGK